jgi:hypothetical protein
MNQFFDLKGFWFFQKILNQILKIYFYILIYRMDICPIVDIIEERFEPQFVDQLETRLETKTIELDDATLAAKYRKFREMHNKANRKYQQSEKGKERMREIKRKYYQKKKLEATALGS